MRKNIYKYKLEDSHNPRVTGKVVMPLGAEILSLQWIIMEILFFMPLLIHANK